jgi:hypothetical protein
LDLLRSLLGEIGKLTANGYFRHNNTAGWTGLVLLGIHHLTEGLKGLAGDLLRRGLQRLVSGRLGAGVSDHCSRRSIDRSRGVARPAIFKAVEDPLKELNAEPKAGREQILEDVALQRIPGDRAC